MLSGSINVVPKRCREAVTNNLTDALLRWGSTWFVNTGNVEVEYSDSLFFDETDYCDGSEQLFDFHALARVASGADQLGDLEPDPELISMVETRLAESLTQVLCLSADVEPMALLQRSGGSVRCHIIIGNESTLSFYLQLNELQNTWPEVFQPVASQPPKFVPRTSVVNNEAVTISFSLKGVALSFGEIVKLQKGDVLQLNHQLDMPLMAKIDDSALTVNPFLVRDKQQKAILLGN